MFQNSFKIAWRKLLKNKYTTAINLAGLVAGMTAALLIWQYVAFEKSYDTFHKQADQIVRVRTDRYPQGVLTLQFAAGAACAGPMIKEHFPEVTDYLKIYPLHENVFANGDILFREKKAAYAGPGFFNFFSFPLTRGDVKTCLAEPWTACLSESTAHKYFGTENPIGKILKANGEEDYKITGVYRDMPENSHLKYDILLSYVTFSQVLVPGGRTETNAFWDGYLTYLALKPGADPAALEAKIPAEVSRKYGEKMRQNNDSISFALLPLKAIHLHSHYLFEAEANGDARAVDFLLIIGGLVLLIAWFNYINLATARSETRAKEVGVRKVVGSGRGSLIAQFLTEACLLNFAAIITSLALARALKQPFEFLVGKPIAFSLFSDPALWASILGVFLVGTLLAGLYPAFVLSAFKPIAVLKGNDAPVHGTGGGWLRKALVVGQFTASVALIAGTIVVFRQLDHLQQAKLGVNIDQTLVVKTPAVVDSTYRSTYETFKQEILHIAAVKSLAGSTTVPGQPFGWTAGGIRRWGAPETESQGLQAMAVDFDFVRAYGMELAAGRPMSEAMRSDSNACMLNEKAVEQLNLGAPAQAVGVDINFWGDKLHIVGVVKNFHQESPKLGFEPVVIRLLNPNRPPGFFSLKLSTTKLPETLAAVESKWSALFPGNPFDYFFLDDHFAEQYIADSRFGRVFGLFSALAIFISCLGLFALAAFVVERRTKEIGIRKVLGASVSGIVALLSKDFLQLIVLALLIASPLAYYFMHQWLQDFAYRIDIQWWVFALAGAAALAVAFVTVGFQGMRAALMNPVGALRRE